MGSYRHTRPIFKEDLHRKLGIFIFPIVSFGRHCARLFNDANIYLLCIGKILEKPSFLFKSSLPISHYFPTTRIVFVVKLFGTHVIAPDGVKLMPVSSNESVVFVTAGQSQARKLTSYVIVLLMK